MADTTRKRDRRARRLEWQRRQVRARPVGPRFDGPGWPTDPPREWPDDPDGGVREPRRPHPGMPAGALSLPEPEELDTLDLMSHDVSGRDTLDLTSRSSVS